MRPDLTPPPREALTPRIYHLVRSIPPGRVMTYGGVAAELGAPRRAREVGWALGRVGPADDVPCHRVLLSTGRPSLGYANGHPELQRQQLEAEGVIFRADGSINLQHYIWWPPDEALEHDPRPLVLAASLIQAVVPPMPRRRARGEDSRPRLRGEHGGWCSDG